MRSGTPVGGLLAASEEGGFWAEAVIVPHPLELVVGLIAFAVFYLVVQRSVVPRFERALNARSEAIEGRLAVAARAHEEAQAMLEQYSAQLRQARDEAAQARASGQSEAQAVIQAAVAEAQQAAQRRAEGASAELLAEVAAARATLLADDVPSVAVALASRVTGTDVAATEPTRVTLDRYMRDLETGASSERSSRTAAVTREGEERTPSRGAHALD